VSLFFALCEFAKKKFVENGLPESRVTVKPNFVADPGYRGSGGGGFLFVGRLSAEKGISTLLKAVSLTQSTSARFRIIGDGPQESLIRAAALNDPRIEYSGRISLPQVLQAMGSASAVLVPSEWHETFGRVAAEALAVGTPVICTNLSGVAEIVDDGRTGLYFRPGDPVGLARILDTVSANPGILAAMRPAARAAYEASYTPERGYEMIMKGFQQAIANP
jgi:glycosyltransferase involved in cell wall biosynthesis